MSKTKRKAYRGSKRFDASCRNHGSCPWCRGNRTYQATKAALSAREQLGERDE